MYHEWAGISPSPTDSGKMRQLQKDFFLSVFVVKLSLGYIKQYLAAVLAVARFFFCVCAVVVTVL